MQVREVIVPDHKAMKQQRQDSNLVIEISPLSFVCDVYDLNPSDKQKVQDKNLNYLA